MYRSIIPLISLVLASYTQAQNLKKDLVVCSLDDLIEQSCGLLSSAYVYDNQYGPRALTSKINYGTSDNANFLIPDLGWHTSKNKVIWTSTSLNPANIKKDKVIFGVTGTLDNTVFGNCILNQMTSETTSPNGGSNCYVPSGNHYVYSSYYGGRNNSCSFEQVDALSYKLKNKYDPLRPKGSCWIDTSGIEADGFNINSSALKTSGTANFVIRNTANALTCPQTGPTIGMQSISCTTPDRNQFNGYFYPQFVTIQVNGANKTVSGAYGGRARNCIYGSNNEPCWIEDPSAYVENDTGCTEKIPDGSVGPLGIALNDFSCKTAGTPRTVFTNNGQSTSTVGRFVYRQPSGGRNNVCNQNSKIGSCFITAYHKSDIEPDLIPENIQEGVVILGVRGNLNLGEIVYGSGAHRSPSGTTSPNRINYKQNLIGESNFLEAGPASSTSALYPTDYHPVPKVATDSEADVSKVNRSTWANTECGLAGTITARTANCVSVFGAADAKWKGTVKGNAGQSDWDLVTRKYEAGAGKTYEVWKDSATGLLWSSLIATNMNWCRASGSNGKKITVDGITQYDPGTSAEDDPSNYCDSATYQSQTVPISACYLDSPQNTANSLFATTYNSTTTPGKARLLPSATTATGRVYWRLPTVFDYILANHHGLRFVLPDIGTGSSDEEWTATTSASNRKNAWTFSGVTGSRQYKQRNNPAAVRCIGR